MDFLDLSRLCKAQQIEKGRTQIFEIYVETERKTREGSSDDHRKPNIHKLRVRANQV